MKLVLLFTLTIVSFIYCNRELKCDFSFGDQKWDYAKIFLRETYYIPAGNDNLEIELKKTPGHMISFVCVNLIGADLNRTKVAFGSIFHNLSITLEEPRDRVVTVQVVAKEHEY